MCTPWCHSLSISSILQLDYTGQHNRCTTFVGLNDKYVVIFLQEFLAIVQCFGDKVTNEPVLGEWPTLIVVVAVVWRKNICDACTDYVPFFLGIDGFQAFFNVANSPEQRTIILMHQECKFAA